MNSQPGTVRLAVIDTDSGFLRVLDKPLRRRRLGVPRARRSRARRRAGGDEAERAGRRPLGARPKTAGPSSSGSAGCSPGSGIVVCTQNSTVAQRVRGLRLGADDWVAKPAIPRRSRPASRRSFAAAGAASRRRTPARWSPASSRSAPTSSRRSSPAAASASPAASSSCSRSSLTARVRSSSARTSTSAYGATRWRTATVRSTSSSASCGPSSQKDSPGWVYIHTHFGVGYRFEPEPASPEPRSAASSGRRARRAGRGGPRRRRHRRLIYPGRGRSRPWFTPFSQVRHHLVTGQPGPTATLRPSTTSCIEGQRLPLPDHRGRNSEKEEPSGRSGSFRRALARRRRLRRRR